MSVSTPRVLVVSESRITRRVVEMTFADQPLQLIACATGAEAAAEWRVRAPAVVLVDLAALAADDFALGRELRAHENGERAAIVLLASAEEAVDDHAVSALRAAAVLRKPLDSHQLVDVVRQALRAGPPAAEPAPVAVPAGAAGASVAVAERERPSAAVGAPLPGVAADDVALLLGAPSPAAAEAREWQQSGPGHEDGLTDTFHALVEVEPPGRRPSPTPAHEDLDRLAVRVAALLAADPALRQRFEALWLESASTALGPIVAEAVQRLAPGALVEASARAIRDLAPAIVEQAAHSAVREEIARLRGVARQV